MKLTKRETTLIFILLFLLLNYCGFNYFIKGIDEDINRVKSENDTLEVDYEARSILAENYVKIQSGFYINQQVLDESKDSFMPYSLASDINAYLEERVFSNLKVQTLNIAYEQIEGLELSDYLSTVRVTLTTNESIGKVMDTLEVIRTLEYKTYLKSFTIDESSSSIEFYIFVRK
ncbi:MAG: hypothetical protein IKM20_07565 [Erysipelotrichales bacterium]|nr:hypothetical protein [Erysipelotrichales bacterium]